MANRWFNQFSKTLMKEVVHIYARVTFGATGAPTLVQGNSPPLSQGVVSVTRNSAGVYTFVFGTSSTMLDVYNKVLMVKHVFDESGNSGTAPVSPGMFVKANSVATAATCSLQIVFNTGGTPTDPASGEAVWLEFIFANSNAP